MRSALSPSMSWSKPTASTTASACEAMALASALTRSSGRTMPKFTLVLPQPRCHKVFELNLVRSRRQRNLDLAEKCVRLRPVVDHQFLVDIQPIATVFSRALNEYQVVARECWA